MLTKIQLKIWLYALLLVCVCTSYFLNFEDTLLTLTLFSFLALSTIILLTRTHWFYFLLIALIPISIDSEILGGSKLSLPSEAMMVVLLLVFVLFHRAYWSTLKRIALHPISILLFVDLLIQLITSFTSTHIDVSLKRFTIKLLFILLFYVAVNMIEKRKSLITVFVCYAVGLVPVMYFTIKHHAQYDFNPRVVFDICAPYFSDHTIYGACLAFIIPLLLILFKSWGAYSKSDILRWSFGLLLLLILVSLFLALSRAAILSVLFAGLFAVLLHYRITFKALIAILSVFIVGIAMNWNSIYSTLEQNESVSNDGEIVNHFSSVSNVRSDASNLERINRWVCAIRMFQSKPLTGFGPGTYQFEYNQFQTSDTKTYISTNAGDRGNAHSEYLTYLSENGAFGFVLFLVLVFTTIYFGMQNHYQLPSGILKMVNLGVLLGITTFFFHGIFNMFSDQIKMAFLIYSSFGVIVWINLFIKKTDVIVEES
ncbi:MAG: hypothetical protein COA32_00620 [Fluviicola sp.]|nr:MAG: hypothetical protein COA32_00620 [Fluviicola sp.]